MKTIFLHIPKAGGTTILDNLKFQLGKKSVYIDYSVDQKDSLRSLNYYSRLSEKRKASYKYFVGHFAYHQGLFGGGENWITVLRDPIARVVSAHKHLMRVGGSAIFPDNTISLIDFVRHPGWRDANNSQVRRLSGCDISSQMNKADFCVTRDDLEVAKKNLEKFKFVGISESIDSQLEQIGSALGLDYMYKIKSNAAPESQSLRLEPDEQEVLREYNTLDIELFEYAKALNASRYLAGSLETNVAIKDIGMQEAFRKKVFNFTHQKNKALSRIPLVGSKIWSPR